MGQKIPPISGKDLIKIISKISILPARQRGSHVQMKGAYNGEMRFTTVPIHGKQIPMGLHLQIIKDCGLTKEEYLKLL